MQQGNGLKIAPKQQEYGGITNQMSAYEMIQPQSERRELANEATFQYSDHFRTLGIIALNAAYVTNSIYASRYKVC